jgi:hypothetical protein
MSAVRGKALWRTHDKIRQLRPRGCERHACSGGSNVGPERERVRLVWRDSIPRLTVRPALLGGTRTLYAANTSFQQRGRRRDRKHERRRHCSPGRIEERGARHTRNPLLAVIRWHQVEAWCSTVSRNRDAHCPRATFFPRTRRVTGAALGE